MIRNVNHIPEGFEVAWLDESSNVLRSWTEQDPLEIMREIDVEPGSIDYANAIEMMTEGYSDVIGPAKAGGIIRIKPVGRINLVPTPRETAIEIEHYVNGSTGVAVGGAVWPDRDAVDVVAAWMHYVDDLTDDERSKLRKRAAEEWGME